MAKFPVRYTEASDEVIQSYPGITKPFNFDFSDAESHVGIDYGSYEAQVAEMALWCHTHFGPEGQSWHVQGWMFSFWNSADAIAFKLRWG
jgi:hypothetical protein